MKLCLSSKRLHLPIGPPISRSRQADSRGFVFEGLWSSVLATNFARRFRLAAPFAAKLISSQTLV